MVAYLASRKGDPSPFFKFRDRLPLTRQKFVAKVREVLEEAGLDPKKYAGHSFRIRAATTAVASLSGLVRLQFLQAIKNSLEAGKGLGTRLHLHTVVRHRSANVHCHQTKALGKGKVCSAAIGNLWLCVPLVSGNSRLVAGIDTDIFGVNSHCVYCIMSLLNCNVMLFTTKIETITVIVHTKNCTSASFIISQTRCGMANNWRISITRSFLCE